MHKYEKLQPAYTISGYPDVIIKYVPSYKPVLLSEPLPEYWYVRKELGTDKQYRTLGLSCLYLTQTGWALTTPTQFSTPEEALAAFEALQNA